jgi:hypothetical protein
MAMVGLQCKKKTIAYHLNNNDNNNDKMDFVGVAFYFMKKGRASKFAGRTTSFLIATCLRAST